MFKADFHVVAYTVWTNCFTAVQFVSKNIKYRKLNPKIFEFKSAINKGFPVVFGFSVPESFENDGPGSVSRTGRMSMPMKNEKVVGTHAVLACGYNDNISYGNEKGFLLVRNSWGSSWGLNGYFLMPYALLNTIIVKVRTN